jgi:hypothetical protein
LERDRKDGSKMTQKFPATVHQKSGKDIMIVRTRLHFTAEKTSPKRCSGHDDERGRDEGKIG